MFRSPPRFHHSAAPPPTPGPAPDTTARAGPSGDTLALRTAGEAEGARGRLKRPRGTAASGGAEAERRRGAGRYGRAMRRRVPRAGWGGGAAGGVGRWFGGVLRRSSGGLRALPQRGAEVEPQGGVGRRSRVGRWFSGVLRRSSGGVRDVPSAGWGPSSRGVRVVAPAGCAGSARRIAGGYARAMRRWSLRAGCGGGAPAGCRALPQRVWRRSLGAGVAAQPQGREGRRPSELRRPNQGGGAAPADCKTLPQRVRRRSARAGC